MPHYIRHTSGRLGYVMLLYPIQAYTSMCVYMCIYVYVYNRTRPASFLWIDNSCLSTRPASKVVRAIACVHVCSSAQAYTRMYTYVPCHNHHSPSNQLAVRPSGHAQQRNQACFFSHLSLTREQDQRKKPPPPGRFSRTQTRPMLSLGFPSIRCMVRFEPQLEKKK